MRLLTLPKYKMVVGRLTSHENASGRDSAYRKLEENNRVEPCPVSEANTFPRCLMIIISIFYYRFLRDQLSFSRTHWRVSYEGVYTTLSCYWCVMLKNRALANKGLNLYVYLKNWRPPSVSHRAPNSVTLLPNLQISC